jgi:hypothetical protein
MATSQSFWNIFTAVIGGLAALITAITGLYLALKNDPSPEVMASVAPVPAAAVPAFAALLKGTAYDRTPWLGIELRQNERPVQLRSMNDAWDQFEATVDGDSFELTITRGADDPSIGILAWHDETIFDCVHDDKFHLTGSGIAGAQFALPILYLNKQGFNYYDSERMKQVAHNKYSISITTIGSGELELPLSRFAGPIYLVIFRVPEFPERSVARRDFELVTLRR